MARSTSKPEVPWAEKHRPRHLGEVIGNTDQVRKLAEWLRDWDDVVFKGKKKEVPTQDANRKFFQAPENTNARAVLVSGPPGIGKTTTCSLVARCNPRYKLMEFNASDARSKAIIDSMSNSLAGNRTLKFGGSAGESALERAVIIMDECDGMAGGGDKGGMQALINLIKNTKNPVICICNDRGDQQVRNLASHCYDLRFRRPENVTVAKRIKSIVESQGKRVDLAAVESVVEACGQDIRQVINHVQFFGSIAGHGRLCQKDSQVMLSPFDACSKLLSSGKDPMPLDKRLDLFYIDADLVPLVVQENYMRPLEKRPGNLSEVEVLERCATASGLIAAGDSLAGEFEVMSSAAVIGTVYPASLMSSPDEAFVRPAFPTWLQKRANLGKADRTLQEISARLKACTSCGCKELVTTGYLEVLYRRLMKPLQSGLPKECAQALYAYGLTRDFFTEQAPVLRQPLQVDDSYRKVDGKYKVLLLQELSQLSQQSGPVKRKRVEDANGASKRRATTGGTEDDMFDDNEEPQVEGAEDEIPGLVKKMAVKPSGKAKSTAKSNSKAKAVDFSKCSLSTWKTSTKEKADGTTESQAASSSNKGSLLVLRYIEGHTCAVRRKVHISDLLRPWQLF